MWKRLWRLISKKGGLTKQSWPFDPPNHHVLTPTFDIWCFQLFIQVVPNEEMKWADFPIRIQRGLWVELFIFWILRVFFFSICSINLILIDGRCEQSEKSDDDKNLFCIYLFNCWKNWLHSRLCYFLYLYLREEREKKNM